MVTLDQQRSLFPGLCCQRGQLLLRGDQRAIERQDYIAGLDASACRSPIDPIDHQTLWKPARTPLATRQRMRGEAQTIRCAAFVLSGAGAFPGRADTDHHRRRSSIADELERDFRPGLQTGIALDEFCRAIDRLVTELHDYVAWLEAARGSRG